MPIIRAPRMWPIFHRSPWSWRRLGSSTDHHTSIADHDEAHVLEHVHEVVPHGGLEEEREVPRVEHDRVDGQRDERVAQPPERAAQPRRRAPAARARRAAGRRPAPGCAARPAGAGRRGRPAGCARPCARSAACRRCVPIGESSAIACSESPRCQRTTCRRGTATPRRAEDPQRPHVQRLRDYEPDDDRHRPSQSGAPRLRARARSARSRRSPRPPRSRRGGGGTPRPRCAAGSPRSS